MTNIEKINALFAKVDLPYSVCTGADCIGNILDILDNVLTRLIALESNVENKND